MVLDPYFLGPLAQALPVPVPVPSDRSLSPLELGGIASIVVGGITALGTQMKPVIDGYWADRRHKREVEVVGLANELNRANREIKLLKEENEHLKALVEYNQVRLDAIETHWASDEPPIVKPCPEVKAAKAILPNLPLEVKEPPPPPPAPPPAPAP